MALSQLPTLPDCVQYLVVDNNQLTQLPALPSSLKKLLANNNQLTQLPELPGSLEELQAHYNQLTRIHDTTKEKPALRLIDERKALQALPPEIVPISSSLASERSLPSVNELSQQPLHHALSVYDQLMEAI